MKEEYKDFIGIYDESVPIELCNMFVKGYDEAKNNRSIIDISKENETGIVDIQIPNQRQDESVVVYPLSSTIYPRPPVEAYNKFLWECLQHYAKRYRIEFNGPLYNDVFKIHKVKKTQGFHIWHYEKGRPQDVDRIMTYMTYLKTPEKGGETEFLEQSLRIDPIVGRTLIWPAGFTHMHRGNPPLDGEKMYITGWITCGKEPVEDIVNK